MKINKKGNTEGPATFILALLLLGIVFMGSYSCALAIPDSRAVDALKVQGFKDVKVVHKDMFFVSCKGGSESDSVRFVCEATNPANQKVKIYVYCGYWKGSTVRSD